MHQTLRAILRGLERSRSAGRRRRPKQTPTNVQAMESRCLLSATVQGQVWDDSNENGIKDESEQFANGQTIQLLSVSGEVLATTETESIDIDQSGQIDPNTESGWYQFRNLQAGQYQVGQAGVSAVAQTSVGRSLLHSRMPVSISVH